MFQFCHNYGGPLTLVNDFWMPAGFRNPSTGGFRNPVRFRNPATLVNAFRMPAELRTPATSKGNLFATTVKVWNTLTFVTSISFLDVTGFLPYTKWTLPYLRWSSYEEWHIHKLYYFGYERGRAKETIESFWHSIHLLQSICFVQSETLAYFCYHQCIFLASSLQNTAKYFE